MALFDIPGWSVVADPVSEPASARKRKRQSVDSEDAKSSPFRRIPPPEFNFDKLVRKLSSTSTATDSTSKPKKQKSKKDKDKVKAKKDDRHAVTISHPMPLKPHLKPTGSTSSLPPNKKLKIAEPSIDDNSHLTPMQKHMRDSLGGARFRIINESLYKADSQDAVQMMQNDPAVFDDYHAGFRHQVQSWPKNPVDEYISALANYPPHTVIVDCGAGDAKLARTLTPRGFPVISYDLISVDPFVAEADCCAKIPLPGSEGPEKADMPKSEGEGQIVDVVICALSLMGTNWPGNLREAWRVLKPGGELRIAEVASRFTDLEHFTTLVGSIGFKLKGKDTSNTHFIMFEFMKMPRKWKSDKEWAGIMAKGPMLKPCEYKRR